MQLEGWCVGVRAPRARRWRAAGGVGGVVRWRRGTTGGITWEGQKIRGSSRIPNTFIYYILVWKIHVLEVLRVYGQNGYG